MWSFRIYDYRKTTRIQLQKTNQKKKNKNKKQIQIQKKRQDKQNTMAAEKKRNRLCITSCSIYTNIAKPTAPVVFVLIYTRIIRPKTINRDDSYCCMFSCPIRVFFSIFQN